MRARWRWSAASFRRKCSPSLQPLLTETEAEICRRGRNAHVSHVPKNSSVADYHNATAFECLFGYLYLSGALDRLRFFFDTIAETAQAGG